MNLQRGFLASCRSEKIPENIAKELAETFMEEKGRYPRTAQKNNAHSFSKSQRTLVPWKL